MKKHNQDYMLKMGFVLIGVMVVLGIIIGSWVWELVFRPDSFDVNKWATKAIFNNALALAMMVLGFTAVNESLKSKEDGKYQLRRGKFNDMVIKMIENGRIVFFDQFISWYVERQVREKKIKHLTKMGLPRMEAEVIVDYAIPADIPVITGLNPGEKPKGNKGRDVVRKDREGNDILIPAVKDTLASYIEDVMSGDITVNAETAAYYTTADRNKEDNLESLEIPKATDKDRISSVRKAFLSKILTTIIYVTIASMLVADLNGDAGTAEALWNFVFRICAATAGFLSGGFSGSTNAAYLYKWLGDKMRVINEYNKFTDMKEFVPKSYAETYKDRIKAAKTEESEPIKKNLPALVEGE